MKYEILVKTTPKDRFDSSINFLRISKTFIFDLIFTLVAIAALVFTIITGRFIQLSPFRKLLIIICPLVFPVIQPIVLYIKSITNTKFDNEIKLSFDDDNIHIESSNDSINLKYINIYNFIKFKNMIVIMYDSVHGQIIPDRFLKFNKDEFYNYVSERINYARKIDQENK